MTGAGASFFSGGGGRGPVLRWRTGVGLVERRCPRSKCFGPAVGG